MRTILAFILMVIGSISSQAAEFVFYGVHAPNQGAKQREERLFSWGQSVKLKPAGNFGGLGFGGFGIWVLRKCRVEQDSWW